MFWPAFGCCKHPKLVEIHNIQSLLGRLTIKKYFCFSSFVGILKSKVVQLHSTMVKVFSGLIGNPLVVVYDLDFLSGTKDDNVVV